MTGQSFGHYESRAAWVRAWAWCISPATPAQAARRHQVLADGRVTDELARTASAVRQALSRLNHPNIATITTSTSRTDATSWSWNIDGQSLRTSGRIRSRRGARLGTQLPRRSSPRRGVILI
jgi:hypothetical protein